MAFAVNAKQYMKSNDGSRTKSVADVVKLHKVAVMKLPLNGVPDPDDLPAVSDNYGLDPRTHSHLFWIPQALLSLPLPAGWILVDDETPSYYRNALTGETKPYHPLDFKFRELLCRILEAEAEASKGKTHNTPCPHVTAGNPCALQSYYNDMLASSRRLETRQERFMAIRNEQIDNALSKISELKGTITLLQLQLPKERPQPNREQLRLLSTEIAQLKVMCKSTEQRAVQAEQERDAANKEMEFLKASLEEANKDLEDAKNGRRFLGQSAIDKRVAQEVARVDRMLVEVLEAQPLDTPQVALLKEALSCARRQLQAMEHAAKNEETERVTTLREALKKEGTLVIELREELAALKKTEARATKDADSLAEKVRAREHSLQLVEEQHRQAQAQIAKMTAEVEMLQAERDGRGSTLQKVEEKLRERDIALEEWVDYERRAEDKLAERMRSMEALRVSNTMLAETVRKLGESQTLAPDLAWKEVFAAQADAARTREAMADLQETIDTLRKQLDESKSEGLQMQEMLSRKYEAKQAEALTLHTANEHLREEMHVMELQLSEKQLLLRQSQQEHHERVVQLRREVQDLETRLSEQVIKCDMYSTETQEANRRLNEALDMSRLPRLEADIERLTRTLAHAQTALKDRETRVSDLQHALQESENKVAELDRKVEFMISQPVTAPPQLPVAGRITPTRLRKDAAPHNPLAEGSDLEARAKWAEEELVEARKDADAAEEALRVTKTSYRLETRQMKAELEAARTDLAKYKKEATESTQAVQRSEEELAKLRARVLEKNKEMQTAAELEVATLKTQMQADKDELKELRQLREDLQKTVKNLEKQLATTEIELSKLTDHAKEREATTVELALTEQRQKFEAALAAQQKRFEAGLVTIREQMEASAIQIAAEEEKVAFLESTLRDRESKLAESAAAEASARELQRRVELKLARAESVNTDLSRKRERERGALAMLPRLQLAVRALAAECAELRRVVHGALRAAGEETEWGWSHVVKYMNWINPPLVPAGGKGGGQHDTNWLRRNVEGMKHAELCERLVAACVSNDKLIAKNATLREHLHNAPNFKACCRLRPLTSAEAEDGIGVTWRDIETISVFKPPGGPAKEVNFSRVLDEATTQEQMFDEVLPHLEAVNDGGNLSIIAYGTGGSGKSYTIIGDKTDEGLLPRCLRFLLDVKQQRADDLTTTIRLSAVEVSNETLHDLLATDGRGRVDLRTEHGGTVVVDNLSDIPIDDNEQITTLTNTAISWAAAAGTAQTIVLVRVSVANKITGANWTGKLALVDLAGREIAGKTGDGKAVAGIQDVMGPLAHKDAHVPYRNSKLTQLLADTLAPPGRIFLIFTVSPSLLKVPDTLGAMVLAQRCCGTATLAKPQSKDDKAKLVELKTELAVRGKAARELFAAVGDLKKQLELTDRLEDQLYLVLEGARPPGRSGDVTTAIKRRERHDDLLRSLAARLGLAPPQVMAPPTQEPRPPAKAKGGPPTPRGGYARFQVGDTS